MNREVLFRGKRVDNGEWVYGSLLKRYDAVEREYFYEIDFFIDDVGSSFFYKVITETIGQFTGLHDKNGTKISEGDIIKTPSDHIYEIFWHIGSYRLKLNSTYISSHYMTKHKANNCEIIGNIYDNSELIEATK